MPSKTAPIAQGRTGTQTGGTGLQSVSSVMIPVTDPDRAIEFYTEALGFTVAVDRPYGNGQRWVEIAPPGGEATLALVPSTSEYAAGSHTGAVLRAANAEATHKRLGENDVDTDAKILGGGGVPSFFWFRDRDGNTLIVIEGS